MLALVVVKFKVAKEVFNYWPRSWCSVVDHNVTKQQWMDPPVESGLRGGANEKCTTNLLTNIIRIVRYT